jgi:hypothetical protein
MLKTGSYTTSGYISSQYGEYSDSSLYGVPLRSRVEIWRSGLCRPTSPCFQIHRVAGGS